MQRVASDPQVLTPDDWREHPDLGNVLPGVPFVRSDWDWCHAKFEEGKADAAAHHEELAAFFAGSGGLDG